MAQTQNRFYSFLKKPAVRSKETEEEGLKPDRHTIITPHLSPFWKRLPHPILHHYHHPERNSTVSWDWQMLTKYNLSSCRWTNIYSSSVLRFLVPEFICQSRMISTSACVSWASTVSLNVSLLSSLCCFMRRWPLRRQVFANYSCGRKKDEKRQALNNMK